MRRALTGALVGVVAAALVLAATTPASAHNFVVSSTPAEGEVLTELPPAWELMTNENLLYVGNTEVFGLWARDAEGLFYGDGCVDVSGAGMSASPVIGEPGDYTLVYAIVSADGHPLTGEIPFEWAPAGAYEAATGTSEAERCGALAEEPPATPGDPGAGIPSDVWWIGGAVLALVTTIAVTALVARRRPRED